MPLTKLVFKPGVSREGTRYSNEGGWYDGDKIRFRMGYVERIGGWEKAVDTQFLGTARKLHNFVDLQSNNYLFVGTNVKAYLENGGIFTDITPVRRTSMIPNPVTGVSATGSIGSVTISIDGNKTVAVQGVSAQGQLGTLESVTTYSNTSFGVAGVGQVGQVTVIATPVDVVVSFSVESVNISEYTAPGAQATDALGRGLLLYPRVCRSGLGGRDCSPDGSPGGGEDGGSPAGRQGVRRRHC